MVGHRLAAGLELLRGEHLARVVEDRLDHREHVEGVGRELLVQQLDRRQGEGGERLVEREFVTAYGEKAAAEQAKVTGGTLWKGLGAVKANKAYVVSDEIWMTGIGVGAANKILDDLAKYLPAA
ncbi:hypothetical protein GCM10023176_10060 [Micromonospora coerulea]|uniref:Fe/B12 periplasmic-binding domain-containing protein n=1 Tax=Micromonospora coerulea TaxID=47856 RepID=A0ABP8SAJ5_9ACTN